VSPTRTFPADPQSIPEARHFVAEFLTDVVPDATRDAIEVMVSELATNAIRHAASGFTLRLYVSDTHVRVEAIDTGSGVPELRSPSPTDPSGRGLRIVQGLSDAWGQQTTEEGKMVWFTIPCHPDPANGEQQEQSANH
jgi:serine/threonine-protein kinase RsbW